MDNLVKHSGQVYTPEYLVKLILDEAEYKGKDILRKHCIDNSCGDGAFLIEIIRRYVNAYQEQHATLEGVGSELSQYIHGIELDPQAFQCCVNNVGEVLCKFGLSSVSIDLINANTLEIRKFDGCMDFVVGNPPYVRVHNLDDNFTRVKEFAFANGGMTDLYLVFFEIGLRMLSNGGKLCYVTPSSWLNSVAGANMRTYILMYRNLLSVIDLGHFQAFKATTYVLISLFRKGKCCEAFAYHEFCPETHAKKYVCDILYDKVCVNGYFYLAKNEILDMLRKILAKNPTKYVSVKNGFATLADKVFIGNGFPFSEFLIPVIKASTGKWYEAFFPYDENGNPIPKEKIFAAKNVSRYLKAKKNELLKKSSEDENPYWYLYGRTQALKDVAKEKISVNTIVKDVKSLKLHSVPAGCGVYGGLYILSAIPMDIIAGILRRQEFMDFIASLKKYKSGGYYAFNSRELEQYLNFKVAQLIEDGKLMVGQIGER